jgi:hypothetical protein
MPLFQKGNSVRLVGTRLVGYIWLAGRKYHDLCSARFSGFLRAGTRLGSQYIRALFWASTAFSAQPLSRPHSRTHTLAKTYPHPRPYHDVEPWVHHACRGSGIFFGLAALVVAVMPTLDVVMGTDPAAKSGVRQLKYNPSS